MKIIFAGPTLHGIAVPGERVPDTDILCRSPAQQGDIARAVLDGASVIGPIDGRYEDVAAPWHKEILYALDRGVQVYGAASMGALRAAECAAYGMVAVGGVAARYLSGDLTDDAAVAQIHGPPELGCVPLSEALVNIEATIERGIEAEVISLAHAAALTSAARSLFFKDRTYPAVVEQAGYSGEQRNTLLSTLYIHRRDIKREDAKELVTTMQAVVPLRPRPAAQSWIFREPTAWRRFMLALQSERTNLEITQ